MTSSRAWFLVQGGDLVVRRQGDAMELPSDEEIAALGIGDADAHDLGAFGERRALAADLGDRPLPSTLEARRLRTLYPGLGDAGFILAGQATQIVGWSQTHRFCGRCATPTERLAEERCMKCPKCGLLGYPRISPAVIVLVRRGDEALLARGARFPGLFYSTLAGFVEVGETLEGTVAREVREEVGVDVKDIRYFGSQPWPFPHALMIGFFAEWAGGDIHADGSEIVDAKWFRANDLPPIPPRLSIARHLIDAWLAEVEGTGTQVSAQSS
jgi:NAD+ diphosphatase